MMSGYSPAFLIYGGLLITYYLICSVLTAGTRWLESRIANRTQRLSPARAVLTEARPQESV
jgi:polar amino acid transport system permease protein